MDSDEFTVRLILTASIDYFQTTLWPVLEFFVKKKKL